MNVVYAREQFPDSFSKSLFLAGPSPRDESHPNWRIEALQVLETAGYDGVVFIPLPRDGKFSKDYDAQVNWEQSAMDRSDVVLFWIPRDLVTLPAFTTNVEFGQRCRNRNVVLGYPPKSPKNQFLGCLGDMNFLDRADTLRDSIGLVLKKIGDGAFRKGGECEVPLYVWRTPHFSNWLQAQKLAGNRLDGFKMELAFGVGPRKSFLFYWAAHVNIYVASEDRNKSNEIVVSRPDIKHTVAFVPAKNWRDTQVLLVREFRSTASIGDCFIREVPGGSGFKPVNPEIAAAQEFTEETGIPMDASRLRMLSARQLAGTTTSHKAYVFRVILTEDEMRHALNMQAKRTAQGNLEETERTYVEIYTVGQLIDQPITDWSNLGMVFAAIGM